MSLGDYASEYLHNHDNVKLIVNKIGIQYVWHNIYFTNRKS